MPPSDFSGRAGRCGVQSLPSLNSGLPLSMSLASASTVAVTPEPEVSLSASSKATSRPATGLSPAAARVFGSVVPPIDVPRADFDAEISTFLRCLPALDATSRRLSKVLASASDSSCFTQSETLPERGVPESGACGASSNPPGADDFFGEFFGDLAMPGIWAESGRK